MATKPKEPQSRTQSRPQFIPARKQPAKKKRRTIQVSSGLIAGTIGGLVATWMLERYRSSSWRSGSGSDARMDRGQRRQAEEQQQEFERARTAATTRLAKTALGGRLSRKQREQVTPYVPYAIGALVGAIYGVSSELLPIVRTGYGTGFASLLFLGGAEPVLPWLHDEPALRKVPAAMRTGSLSPQIFYAGVLETTRRVVRWML